MHVARHFAKRAFCQAGVWSSHKLIQKTIRRKICGQAADVFNSSNITSKWSDIKEKLLLYYCDKRDFKTLDFKLTTVKRGISEPLNSYYGRVNELLASLVRQVQTQDSYKNNASVHIDFFREKALDAFIRGLDKPLSILLKTASPTSLAKAYQFCLEHKNMDCRS